MPERKLTRPDLFDKTFVESHRDWLREVVIEIVHQVMEAEVSTMTGAGYGERNPERTTHRNGYRERQWTTRLGDINLEIPKLREGSTFRRSWSPAGGPRRL